MSDSRQPIVAERLISRLFFTWVFTLIQKCKNLSNSNRNSKTETSSLVNNDTVAPSSTSKTQNISNNILNSFKISEDLDVETCYLNHFYQFENRSKIITKYEKEITQISNSEKIKDQKSKNPLHETSQLLDSENQIKSDLTDLSNSKNHSNKKKSKQDKNKTEIISNKVSKSDKFIQNKLYQNIKSVTWARKSQFLNFFLLRVCHYSFLLTSPMLIGKFLRRIFYKTLE